MERMNRNLNGLELNLTMSQDRITENNRSLNIDNNLRNLQLDRQLHLDREINLERSLSSERLNIQNNIDERALNERISPERLNNDRLNIDSRDMTDNYKEQMNELKYREYKNHLDCLRGIDGRNDVQNDEGRGTPSTPPTPVSVGENNYQEEKVLSLLLFLSGNPRSYLRLPGAF